MTSTRVDPLDSRTTQHQQQPQSEQAAQPDGSSAGWQATYKQPQLPFAEATPSAVTLSEEDPYQAEKLPASVSIHPLSSTVLPATGTSDAVSSDVLGVLGAWHAMYCPDKEAHLQAALAAGFDTRASFEDNFLQVTGHDQLNALFYALQRCTDHIRIHIEKLEVQVGNAVDAAASAGAGGSLLAHQLRPPGVYQLRITGRHAFFMPKSIRGPGTSWFLPPAIEAWATDVLTVRQSDNKITHWQQRVHNIPVAPGPLRWSVGLSGSMLLMHMLGW